jgi:hypothetical protein
VPQPGTINGAQESHSRAGRSNIAVKNQGNRAPEHGASERLAVAVRVGRTVVQLEPLLAHPERVGRVVLAGLWSRCAVASTMNEVFPVSGSSGYGRGDGRPLLDEPGPGRYPRNARAGHDTVHGARRALETHVMAGFVSVPRIKRHQVRPDRHGRVNPRRRVWPSGPGADFVFDLRTESKRKYYPHEDFSHHPLPAPRSTLPRTRPAGRTFSKSDRFYLKQSRSNSLNSYGIACRHG